MRTEAIERENVDDYMLVRALTQWMRCATLTVLIFADEGLFDGNSN